MSRAAGAAAKVAGAARNQAVWRVGTVDRDAFGQLYARHRERLQAVARRIVGDEAEDALQDAMIKAYRHARAFRGHSAVSTWLHRIVVNAALDCARRRPLVLEPDETMPGLEPHRSDDQQDIRRAGKVLNLGQQIPSHAPWPPGESGYLGRFEQLRRDLRDQALSRARASEASSRTGGGVSSESTWRSAIP